MQSNKKNSASNPSSASRASNHLKQIVIHNTDSNILSLIDKLSALGSLKVNESNKKFTAEIKSLYNAIKNENQKFSTTITDEKHKKQTVKEVTAKLTQLIASIDQLDFEKHVAVVLKGGFEEKNKNEINNYLMLILLQKLTTLDNFTLLFSSAIYDFLQNVVSVQEEKTQNKLMPPHTKLIYWINLGIIHWKTVSSAESLPGVVNLIHDNLLPSLSLLSIGATLVELNNREVSIYTFIQPLNESSFKEICDSCYVDISAKNFLDLAITIKKVNAKFREHLRTELPHLTKIAQQEYKKLMEPIFDQEKIKPFNQLERNSTSFSSSDTAEKSGLLLLQNIASFFKEKENTKTARILTKGEGHTWTIIELDGNDITKDKLFTEKRFDISFIEAQVIKEQKKYIIKKCFLQNKAIREKKDEIDLLEQLIEVSNSFANNLSFNAEKIKKNFADVDEKLKELKAKLGKKSTLIKEIDKLSHFLSVEIKESIEIINENRLAPISSALAPVSSALAPVSSALAPVSSALAPVSSALAPVSSALAPVSLFKTFYPQKLSQDKKAGKIYNLLMAKYNGLSELISEFDRKENSDVIEINKLWLSPFCSRFATDIFNLLENYTLPPIEELEKFHVAVTQRGAFTRTMLKIIQKYSKHADETTAFIKKFDESMTPLIDVESEFFKEIKTKFYSANSHVEHEPPMIIKNSK